MNSQDLVSSCLCSSQGEQGRQLKSLDGLGTQGKMEFWTDKEPS